MNEARLQELRAEHRQCGEHHVRSRKAHCVKCLTEQPWPCEQSVILDLALEAERLRSLRDGCKCDPPGSGEEWCVGNCYLRAEVERLRTVAAAALEAMEYMGDQLNGMDAASAEGVAKVSPAFTLVRRALAGTEATP